MATTDDHPIDPEQAGGGTAAGGSGDLEFDEAWGGAGAVQGAGAEPEPADPRPAFEDPNDR